MWDITSENLSTVNKLYHFPGHDLISGQEVALGRFPLTFWTDVLYLQVQWPCFDSVEVETFISRNGEKVFISVLIGGESTNQRSTL